MEWISVKDRLPDDGIPVKTKIDDKYGLEMKQFS